MSQKDACIRYQRDWAKRTVTITLRGGRSGYGRIMASEIRPTHLSQHDRERLVGDMLKIAAERGYSRVWDDATDRCVET